VTDAKAATSILFPTTDDLDAARSGVLYPLLLSYEPKPGEGEKRQFTDAVAVAGLQAVTGARRRAVVLVLSSTADASDHDPAAVRHYLAALGVPLFVWSVRGPRPDLAGTWGDVDDISSLPKLQAAAARLQHALDEQRVAWVEVDPVTALALRADGRCGITPLASLASAR
jgi:hypothetical protein